MITEERLLWLAQSPANKSKEKAELAREVLKLAKLRETISTLTFRTCPPEGGDVCEDCNENYRKLNSQGGDEL